MMTMEKTMTGLTYIALGAFAAYLGFWWTEAGRQTHVLPVLFSLGMAATGLAMVSRSGRRQARPESDGGRGRSTGGRLEAGSPMEAVNRRLEPAPLADRGGDAALLGHEMKNYLCTLKGNARLLRQRVKGGDSDIIDRIDRVVEKLESFTQTMASPANAVATGRLWHLRLADAAKACVKTHFHTGARGFRWDCLPDAPAVLGDPDRMEQVFLNLYANALEAGATKVTTSVRSEGGRIQVRIEDDGRGCAREDLERIFEPFFTTKQGPARRGLGMFIVQSIVENHGGRIQVKTKNGSGAGQHGLVFALDFPSALPATGEIRGLRPVPLTEGKSSPRWLLALPEPI
ncbi:MAG: multi-sensor signal transduction histidine kinase [Fibrobacteres bacterium]|nr:multi-sensor signal transduction histidine kinase [Fibrobacterota bacterium]